jgi:threonine/homoserine/homoserine lactone efflux protein
MELTPGPNMTWLALLAAREGRRAGFMAVAGIALGLTIVGVLAAAGLAVALEAWPLLWEALRWAGVLFLVYLAFESWVGEKVSAKNQPDETRHFRRGLIVNLLNPKAAAVFVVLIPALVGEASLPSTILHTAIYLALATAVHALIVAFASNLQAFATDPKREKPIRRIFAVLLLGVAIWMAISTAR